MKRFSTILYIFLFQAALAWGQISFINKNVLLPNAQVHSGVAIAVLDMNNDGLDDIVRLSQGTDLMIEYQNSQGGAFSNFTFGTVLSDPAWGMCAADIDNNGFPDVLAGGFYEGIKILRADADGQGYSLENIQNPGTFVQAVNFIDMDNDGWLDAFVCHDDGLSRTFHNNGDGGMTYKPEMLPLATLPASDGSGNYGSVWSDVNNDGLNDLYIAKCRQAVNEPTDPRRINQLFLNQGNGVFVQDSFNTSGLRIGAQSWTADFGDIDNDGDMDCFVTNHDVSSQLLENDGLGHFTDISASSGILNAIVGLPIQGIFRDFDNDGFVDILVAGSKHFLFKNNGNKTFSLVPDLFDNNDMESFAVGDLNHDGFTDIYAGYAQIYSDPSNIDDVLWMNEGNGNHYVGLILKGVSSNQNGVGSRIKLHTPNGIQLREVRSGESYGIMNSLQTVFGLGQGTVVDSISVFWPSGIVDVIKNPSADQYLTLQEGGCVLPAIVLSVEGNTTICSGQSVTLKAPEGYSYQWNTGETTQSIQVGQGGLYFATVTSGMGCKAISNKITVVLDPVEIPIISILSDSVVCSGDAVLLSASPSSSYLWSNGATTQTISVSESGTYTVTTQGVCQMNTSGPVTANILNAEAPIPQPPLPTWTGGVVQLEATGNEIHWYDAATGGAKLYVGTPFVTPPLNENTTYWASNVKSNDKPNDFVGMLAHEGSNFSGLQYNGQIIFDCLQPFRLKKVKVYSALEAVRRIILIDQSGQELQGKSVNIPEGTSYVDLDFDVPVGTGLMLTTDESVNQTNINSISPQLRRSDIGVDYPYTLQGVVSLKGSNLGEERYYYFYEWEVDYYGLACESDRVPVLAVVDPNLVSTGELVFSSNISVVPNPTKDMVAVHVDGQYGRELRASVCDIHGKILIQTQIVTQKNNQIDLSALPTGIYVIDITGLDADKKIKIIKI